MIFSENRCPLFRIMLQEACYVRRKRFRQEAERLAELKAEAIVYAKKSRKIDEFWE
jgi:hypothetical protein